MNETIEAIGMAFVLIILTVGIVIGIFWVGQNAPTDSMTRIKVERIGEFVCHEKYGWRRKNYSKTCIEWPESKEE